MNETVSTIYARRSIRMFKSDQVSEEQLKTILDAANQAPSAHNLQSWKFVILQGEKKQSLVNLVNGRANGFPKPSSTLLRMAARSIAGAPVVIAVVNTGELIHHGTKLFNIDSEQSFDFFRVMEIQSSAAAVQNMMLAATSIGLGTVWLGILVLIKDEVLKFINEPEGEFMAVIPVGYPLRVGKGPKKKELNWTVLK